MGVISILFLWFINQLITGGAPPCIEPLEFLDFAGLLGPWAARSPPLGTLARATSQGSPAGPGYVARSVAGFTRGGYIIFNQSALI